MVSSDLRKDTELMKSAVKVTGKNPTETITASRITLDVNVPKVTAASVEPQNYKVNVVASPEESLQSLKSMLATSLLRRYFNRLATQINYPYNYILY